MAAANEDDVVVRPKLPMFRGNSKDALDIKAWCEGVERAKEQHTWSEEKTASYAIDALREQASAWQQVAKVENPDGVTKWEDLKKLMLSEFSPAQTAAQRIQLVSNLKQKSTEMTGQFYVRVALAIYETTKKAYEAIRDPNKDEKRQGFVACRTENIKSLFLAGLRPEIRVGVEARLQDEWSVDEIKKAASQQETATGANRAAAVIGEAEKGAAVVVPPSQGEPMDVGRLIQQQVAAAFKATGSTGTRQKAWINMDAPKEPRETPATMKLGPIKKRDWIYCQRCGIWGQHIRAECKLSPNAVKAATKQDPKNKPSGSPSDVQYPN